MNETNETKCSTRRERVCWRALARLARPGRLSRVCGDKWNGEGGESRLARLGGRHRFLCVDAASLVRRVTLRSVGESGRVSGTRRVLPVEFTSGPSFLLQPQTKVLWLPSINPTYVAACDLHGARRPLQF